MPQTSSSQSSYIDLITSDEPPVRLSISRSVLSSFSTTFKDLLSIPLDSNTSSSIEIPVTETEEQLKGFWKMLKSIETGEEADLNELGSVDWENLARLSDKYDSLIARITVKSYIWECIAKDSQHETRFYLAVALEDVDLVGRTCIKAIPQNWHLNDKVPQEWQIRITHALNQRRLQVFEYLVSEPRPFATEPRNCECSRSDVDKVWQIVCDTLLRSYTPDQTIAVQVAGQGPAMQVPPFCPYHQIPFISRGCQAEPVLSDWLDMFKSSNLDT